MLLIIQLCLFFALFTALVYLFTGGKAVNALYFYPKPVQERAFAIGLADRADVARKHRRFLTLFPLMMLAVLLLIIGAWNGVRDFKTAYLQSLLLLEGMNWYDGVVIDRLWVGHSRFWVLPGTEDIPFVQTWPQVLKKRGKLTLVWIVGAAAVAALVVWIF